MDRFIILIITQSVSIEPCLLYTSYPILEKIVDRFKKSVANDATRQEAVISYDIYEYDERFLRPLALGYTKEMIAYLRCV